MVLINKMVNSLLKHFFKKEKPFKQELLFRKALNECGVTHQKSDIYVDHLKGINYFKNLKFNIIYPATFVNKCIELSKREKLTNIYFNGFEGSDNGRKELLKPFYSFDNVNIVFSKEGRIQKKKDVFNNRYYEDFSSALFGLIPHQIDWPGSKSYVWTYRFIESCLVKSMPILFKQTPLGNNFINKFYYYWNTDILANPTSYHELYNKHMVEHNQKLAITKFTFNDKDIKMLKEAI